MIINKIKLVNFKNFDTVEVHLNPMNVIVGANASGKSNFIQALKFLRDIKDFGIENALSLQGSSEYLQNLQLKGEKKTSIVVEYMPSTFRWFHYKDIDNQSIMLARHFNYQYIIEINFSEEDENLNSVRETLTIKTLLKWKDSANNGINVPVLDNFYSTFVVEDGKLKREEMKGYFEKGNVSVTLPTGITVLVERHKLTPEWEFTEDKNATILSHSSFDAPISTGIYDFDLKKAKSSTPITGKADLEENGENLAIVLRNILKDKEKSRQFSNLMKDMLPFIKQLDIDKFYDKSLLFKIKEIYNHNTFIPSALLSDGTISVTAIVVALFFQNKHLAIFEEPEHGLHPALIAQLMQLFYSAAEEKQIIVTTHNPEVLKHTRLEDLLLVSRNEKGFAVITKPAEQIMVKAFLENELGIEQLFIQNLLDA